MSKFESILEGGPGSVYGKDFGDLVEDILEVQDTFDSVTNAIDSRIKALAKQWEKDIHDYDGDSYGGKFGKGLEGQRRSNAACEKKLMQLSKDVKSEFLKVRKIFKDCSVILDNMESIEEEGEGAL